MQAGLQAVQPTHKMPTAAKPHRVAPDALDLLEQFGSVVTVHRSHEIYGQGEPAEYLLANSLRLRSYSKVDRGWTPTDRRIPVAGRPTWYG